MKKEFGEYYLGLDIGTNSIGWAVTDKEYNLLKFNGKYMWGIRLFDEANSAEERRMFRTARRRLDRRNDRLNILQELFAEEISKVDPAFFIRLKESKYYPEDKKVDGKYSLFFDKDYTDIDYHNDFPTIYHLRKELIDNPNPHDVRLVYLAIHNILKHRGHFLIQGQDLSAVNDFESLLKNAIDSINAEFDLHIECVDYRNIAEILKNRNLGISKKQKALIQEFAFDEEEKTQVSNIAKLLSGGKVDIKSIFLDDAIIIDEIKSMSFSSKWDEDWPVLQNTLGEYAYLVELLKAVYDWGLLAEILNGEQYISHSKVRIYDKHSVDLKTLKKYVKLYVPEKYKEVFSVSEKGLCNYVAYSGTFSAGGKKKQIDKRCNQSDFCAYIKGLFAKVNSDDPEFLSMISDVNNGIFMPKQVVTENNVIPYQVHREELKAILKNAEAYLPFLSVKDSSNLTVSEKILDLLEFRIPYYVGPVNVSKTTGSHAWAVRKESGKVYPWNFEEKIDTKASAEEFIMRMTNKCTYLVGADVLPKNSLLYSKFMVLNELNNLKINQENISVELKQNIYHDLFETRKKVTNKALVDYLRINAGFDPKTDVISGIDGDFKSNLATYIDMKQILGDKVSDTSMVEDIIKAIVLFGDDKKMLKETIVDRYGKKLDESEIKLLLTKQYSGWGRLSRELLDDITCPDSENGEYLSIISALWNLDGNPNLMQLLSSKYGYAQAIEAYNNDKQPQSVKLDYSVVDNLYVSPAVKRMLWQTLLIVKEIKKVTGHDPRRVFIEMARGEDEVKKRTESRQKKLINLYEACKDEERDWIKELTGRDEAIFRSDRLYLYYTQKGRCMYSGEPIDLAELYNENLYDVDHIYPQSKCKDDSLDNRVLVKSQLNKIKTDEYPIKRDWQQKNFAFWKDLFDNGFISKKKYDRLTRQTSLSNDELAGFIERQLVETRQTSKAAADILGKCLDSTIVYVKAGNASDFRHDIGFVKCREVNDYHHAQDAYLNIVVGNVYYTKFTLNPRNFIEHEKSKYNLNKMFNYDVVRNGEKAWDMTNGQSYATVKKTMANNHILFTRYATCGKGALFDQNLMPKGFGQVKIKDLDGRMNIEKYGGYNKASGAYFVLVEHTKKGKRVRSLENIPVYLARKLESSADAMTSYLIETLGLKDPVVRYKKIKMNSLISIGKFKAHITGRSNDAILIWNANQLILNNELYKYFKKLSNYSEYCKRHNVKIGTVSANVIPEISVEKNVEMFNHFAQKINSELFRDRMASPAELLANHSQQFEQLSIENQIVVLLEIVHYFQCNSVSSDVTLIGGPKRSGVLHINKELNIKQKFLLFNQSVTGLFEQVIDLNKI